MSTSPPLATAPTPRPLHVLSRWFAVGVGLTAVTTVGLALWVGPRQIRLALGGLGAGWLAAAVAAEVLALTCLVRAWTAAAASTGHRLPAREAATIALGSFSLSQLLPAGGAAGAVFAARRLTRRTTVASAATTVGVVNVVSLTTLGLIVTVGTGVAALVGGADRAIATATGLGTLGLVAVTALVARGVVDVDTRHRLVRAVARATRRDDATIRRWTTAAGHGDLVRHPGQGVVVMAWSAGTWLLDIAVLWAVATAAGLELGPLAIVATYGVANLANAVPLTPGGIGLVEAGITGTLVALGADPASAAVVALGYRLIGDLLPVAVAAPVVLSGWRGPPARDPTSSTRAVDDPAPADTFGAHASGRSTRRTTAANVAGETTTGMVAAETGGSSEHVVRS